MTHSAGKVYLIGAGPGDLELLTLKAVRVLGGADVALIDDLVNPDIQQFLKPGCRIVPVGKRGGCKSTPQRFIHKQMVALAGRGQVVARVKGGDPFIFGRGGEEMAELQAAGVAVEAINGITSGIGGPASIGIPATHRGMADGVTLITGHTYDGAEPNWQALAHSGTTLVIYMGMKRLESIVTALLQAGMARTTPAAIIQHATLPQQRSLVTTLENLADDATTGGFGSPAIVVVGATASLAQVENTTLQHYLRNAV